MNAFFLLHSGSRLDRQCFLRFICTRCSGGFGGWQPPKSKTIEFPWRVDLLQATCYRVPAFFSRILHVLLQCIPAFSTNAGIFVPKTIRSLEHSFP